MPEFRRALAVARASRAGLAGFVRLQPLRMLRTECVVRILRAYSAASRPALRARCSIGSPAHSSGNPALPAALVQRLAEVAIQPISLFDGVQTVPLDFEPTKARVLTARVVAPALEGDLQLAWAFGPTPP